MFHCVCLVPMSTIRYHVIKFRVQTPVLESLPSVYRNKLGSGCWFLLTLLAVVAIVVARCLKPEVLRRAQKYRAWKRN